MEQKIETRVTDSLVVAAEKFRDAPSVKRFEESKDEFKELVRRGVAHERGNHLLSTSDAHQVNRVSFNLK